MGEDKNPKELTESSENVLREFEGQSHSRGSFASPCVTSALTFILVSPFIGATAFFFFFFLDMLIALTNQIARMLTQPGFT